MKIMRAKLAGIDNNKKMKKENFKILRTRKYYPFPSSWNLLVHSSHEAETICGQSFANIYFLFDNGFVSAFYPTKEWSKIGSLIVKKVIKNQDLISNIDIEQKKRGKKLKLLSHKITGILKNKKITVSEMNKFSEAIKNEWLSYNNLELCWYIGADFLKEYIMDQLGKLRGRMISDEELQLITTPAENTFSADEEIEILKAAIRVKKDGSINLIKEIRNLSDKYYWIPFGYDGPIIYNQTHYRNILDEMVSQKSLKDLEGELALLESRNKILIKKQQKIFDKYQIKNSLRRLFSDLNTMTMMADKRKEYTSYGHIAYDALLDCYAQKLKISKEKLKYLDIAEILNNLDKGSKIKQVYKQRKNYCLIGIENHRLFIDVDAKAQEFIKLIIEEKESNFVRGVIASKGAKNIIKSTVKILFTSKDLVKVEKGDIVVSPMTTPEFVFALRKASAIITDEGGITCHAAIISRELNIPCIIGTKNATKVFCDGDIIEMDANEGVAKILERPKR